MLCILISTSDGKIYKGEFKEVVEANVSMMKEENRVKGASEMGCYALKESDTKTSCMHENVCYALDISTIAVNSVPSSPVKGFVKKQVRLPTEGI